MELVWSEGNKRKYIVSRQQYEFQVDTLRRCRVKHKHEHLDFSWFTYEWKVIATSYVSVESLTCDALFCPDMYYTGVCIHAQIVQDFHKRWNTDRSQYIQKVYKRLQVLVDLLKLVSDYIRFMKRVVSYLRHSTKVKGLYILFTPDFLYNFSTRQLLFLMQAVGFPIEKYLGLSKDALLKALCLFVLKSNARPLR